MKQVIRVRNQNPVIARGTTAYLEQYSGEQCFALTRSYEGSNLLLLGNTSAEAVSVDLTGLTVGGTTAEHKIGKVTYLVCSSASERATDTLDKKIKKLIRKDMELNPANARK